MTNPPLAREGDPPANPVSTRVPVVETVPSTFSSDSSARPTPFQQLPYQFNQQLKNFSGFLTPIRNSIAPLFSVNPTQAPMATTQPVDSHLNLVQNDLPIPSSVGIDPDHGLPRTNQATNQTTQDPQQELSSDQLDSSGFDWSVDEEYCLFFHFDGQSS